jgi:putative ABC transport system ATP-binding protein
MPEWKNPAVLELHDLKKSYRKADGQRLEVIRISNLLLTTGEQVAMVGASGSGKSTLLNLIAGIVLPDAGTVLVNGTDITRLTEAERDRFRAAHVGYVFQSFNLLQGFTALENVLLGQMFATGHHDPHRAVALLETVGLGNRLHHKPRSLSVGEQQRIAIARALVNAPPLVLADEPTGSLDAENGAIVLELLRRVCRENHHTLLLVTHDPRVEEQFTKVIRLEELE